MQILIRKINDQTMVWAKAKYVAKHTFMVNIDGEDQKIYLSNVISIYNDNRSKYLYCSGCGEIIRNAQDDIEKHLDKRTSTEVCLSCRDMKVRDTITIKKAYKIENGKCIASTIQEGVPCCGRTGWYRNILQENGKSDCKYRYCTNERLRRIEDVFTEYSVPFDDLITVDKVIEYGYRDRRSGAYYDTYELKARNTIIVYVSKDTNIVTHFDLHYRDDIFSFMYSKKYNKIFIFDGNSYSDESEMTRYGVPSSTIENVKEKIAGLYR